MGLSPGSRLGPYEILASIGAGGMGEVYRARDHRIERDVAIKVLPESFAADPDRVARFEREARAAGALNHPSLVTIFDVSRDQGTPYMVMELLDGVTLREALKAGALPVETAIHHALQIADGLAAAHDRGITHRDLKPENIITTRDGRVKVIDFGLARQQQLAAVSLDDAATEYRPTAAGTLIGTLTYMAPEQIRGEPADPRSDIFAVGNILHEMLSGAPPFERPSQADTMSAILRDDPAPLTVPAGTPPALARIVKRCLEKDPRDRFSSARELWFGLREVERETQTAGGPSPMRSAGAGRRPILLGAAVLMLLVIAIQAYRAVRTTTAPHHAAPSPAQPAKRPMIAVLPFENLGAPVDAYFAAGITEEITSRLTSLRQLGVISRTSAAEYDRKEKTMKHIGRDLGVDYVLEGSVRWDRNSNRIRVTPQLIRVADDTSLFSEQYDRMPEQIFEVQSDIAQRVVERLNLALFETERAVLAARPTMNFDAYQAYLEAFDSDVSDDSQLRKALAALRRAVQLDPRFGAAYARLGYMHAAMFHTGFDRSPARLKEAKAAIDTSFRITPDSPEANLALAYWHYWGYRDYPKALEVLERLRQSRPNDPELLRAIAAVQRRSGRVDLALNLQEEALRLDPRNRTGLVELGWTYVHTRRFREGEQVFGRVIALFPAEVASHWNRAECIWRRTGSTAETRVLLAAMPEVADESSTLGLFFQELLERRYDAALQRIRSSNISLFHFTFGGEQAHLPKDYLLGRTYTLMGRTADANESLRRALLDLENAAGELPDNPRIRSALGLTYAYLQRKSEAVKAGESAVHLQPVSADALSGPQRLVDLAEIYAVVGRQDDAIDTLQKTLAIPCKVSPEILHLDPTWDSLRKNPRFVRLIGDKPTLRREQSR